MRRTLLALSVALLPLSFAHADSHEHDHAHEEHGSLGAHEHGVASLNVALDGAELTIEMDTPADNLLGFEHLPRSAAEKSQAGNVLTLLSQPKKLFRLNPEAQCLPDMPAIDAPLLLGRPVSGEHNDISATFVFRCAKPAALSRLESVG